MKRQGFNFHLLVGVFTAIALIGSLTVAIGGSAGSGGSPSPASPSPTLASPATQPAVLGQMRVARFIYGNQKTDNACFSSGFLDDVARQTSLNLKRTFDVALLSDDVVFSYPFAVLTGTESMKLNAAELKNLKSYLDRGGFLLASASCSNPAWADSFMGVMNTLYPQKTFTRLAGAHPVFHRLYDVESLTTKHDSNDPSILALEINGRIAVVYSPLGLNDTANAGGGCCCCGGNEIRDAKLINANILMYALTP